jgi:hypothetical protein
MLHEFLIPDHAIAMLDQIPQHIEHFGIQLQKFSRTAELGETGVELPLAEDVDYPHGATHGSFPFCEFDFPATIGNG